MKTVVPAWMKPVCDAYAFPAAVIDGDLVRCSGVIGFKPDLSVPAEPEAQFTLAFENLKGVLEEAGTGFADVVEMNTYHVGLQAHMQTFVSVKNRFMKPPYAAWTAIGITELALPGALVEIQVTARRKG
jgi:enamine deaminase RidA (YjgF/YER057c/UK114 family)